MGYSQQEFNTAFEKVVSKYPDVRRSKAENVLANAARLWAQYKSTGKKFGEIIRLALNESNVWREEERSAYGSLIGNLYSPRAQAAKRYRKTATPRKSTPPKTPQPPAIVVEAKGQLAWEI